MTATTGPITPIAQIENASKRYGSVHALVNVDLWIARGEVRALLGKNGAGKSTVIRLLAGVESPDSGAVILNGTTLDGPGIHTAQDLGVRTVYQELTLIPQMTVAENLFMGSWPRRRGQIDYHRMRDASDHALARLGLKINSRRLIAELSIADQQMVEIARAVSKEPALLILDEPTSSLAAAEVDRVLDVVDTIRQHGVAVVYVSHRVSEIRRVADSVTIMRDGRVIETLPMDGVTTEEIVHMMLGSEPLETPLVTTSVDPGPVALSVDHVSLAPKLEDVSVQVRRGEVLGIAGVQGSGRTELLSIMAGLREADSGTVEMEGKRIHGQGLRRTKALGIGFTPEDRKNDGIIPDMGVDENIVLTDWAKVTTGGVIRAKRMAAAATSTIESMSVRTRKPQTPIGALSGGNQQKVVIGRWLHANSKVLLLDEPTRGVDVQAKSAIYELLRALAASGTAVVFVSSEMDELKLVCDRAIVLLNGRIVSEQSAPHIETDLLLLAAIAGDPSR